MDAVDELNFLLGIGPPRPKIPVTLQKSGYTSVRALGKGSFGQAFLVFHKEKGQYYVVKHVNMTNMTSNQRKDAHNEIAVLQQLYHPNIVRYVEYFEEHPHLYIVMEYADGGDLFSHLNRIQRTAGPFRTASNNSGNVSLLTESQVISLFVQTTMAVKYMHDRRLLHRDIKSQNVFLTHNHVVKLGDFGITTVLQNTVAMASTMCGTPCYFSPELCQGKPYNNKSDIWALGVLLYELCAGRLPFESNTMKALMREIVNKHPRRIPFQFSDELWKLVQWMLKKDPKDRPDAGQVLMTPVLMRQLPNIITQLQTAEFVDINPHNGVKAKEDESTGGGVSPRSEKESIADTEPYQQLLACQQEEVRQGKLVRGNSTVGMNPFKGAPPAGDPTRRHSNANVLPPSPHSPAPGNKTPVKVVAPTPAAAPAAAAKQPNGANNNNNGNMSPGQKAARDVMAASKEQPAPQAKANGDANKKKSSPTIGELLAKFDEEKKRIYDGRKNNNHNHNKETPPFSGDPSISDLDGMIKEMSCHLTQFQSSVVQRDAPSPPPRDNLKNVRGEQQQQQPKAAAAPPASSAAKKVPPTSSAQAPAPAPAAANGKTAPGADKNETFCDPRGAKLDVEGIQSKHDATVTATSTGISAPSYSSDVFQRSLNRKFDATNLSQVSSAKATPKPQADAESVFVGSCICGNTTLQGQLSAIYGSFVCTCDACCRSSGSSGGIEWLHLPGVDSMKAISDVPVVKTITKGNVSSSVSAARGAGSSAASTLKKENGKSAPPATSSSCCVGIQGFCFSMMVEDDDYDDGNNNNSNSNNTKLREARFTAYFCSECGCTIGMLHDDLPGVLLSKTVLSVESAAVLARFAQTVMPGED